MIINLKIKILILSIVFLMLAGCASWFYTPGKSELKRLCEKDGGVQIYETVEVEGYFNGYLENCYACWNEIIRTGYEYIEFENSDPKQSHAIREPGYWRLEKVRRDSGQCNQRIDKKLEKKRGRSEYDEFLDGYCIAAQKIDKPQADYAISGDESEWVVNEYYDSTITRLSTRVWDFGTNKNMGTRVNYLLNPWPNSALDYGVVNDCIDIGLMQIEQPLLYRTLKVKSK